MLQEFCIPLTMRIIPPGHPFVAAQWIGAVILIQVVLLCAMAGRTVRLPGNGSGPEERMPWHSSHEILSRRSIPAGMRGLIPATAGIAGKSSCPVLHT